MIWLSCGQVCHGIVLRMRGNSWLPQRSHAKSAGRTPWAWRAPLPSRSCLPEFLWRVPGGPDVQHALSWCRDEFDGDRERAGRKVGVASIGGARALDGRNVLYGSLDHATADALCPWIQRTWIRIDFRRGHGRRGAASCWTAAEQKGDVERNDRLVLL